MNRCFLLLAVFAAACGPVYDTRYEYESEAHTDRQCAAQCHIARGECRRDNARIVAEQERQALFCSALAELEDEKKKRRRYEEKCGLLHPVGAPATDCVADFNECFIICGGTVREVRECVFNCDAQ